MNHTIAINIPTKEVMLCFIIRINYCNFEENLSILTIDYWCLEVGRFCLTETNTDQQRQ